MKNNSKVKMLGLTVAGVAIGVAGSSVSGEETLDFVTGLGNSGGIPDAYGDNLTTTPNIDLTWNTAGNEGSTDGWDSYINWDGRGEVAQTDYGQSSPLSVFLTPDAGFGAYVVSFDLDEFVGGGDSVVDWSVLSAGETLFSGTWDDFSDAVGGDGGRSTVVTGMTAADALNNGGEVVEVRLTLASGATSYQAMDNFTFGQVTAIPEPGTLGLLAIAGIGALTMRRRSQA